ncbi:MAG TPA: hypothetical protein VEK08_04570 [Planctomycetota bacterium]|nr:hypothetical protein [Planctomycetota bacterium]
MPFVKSNQLSGRGSVRFNLLDLFVASLVCGMNMYLFKIFSGAFLISKRELEVREARSVLFALFFSLLSTYLTVRILGDIEVSVLRKAIVHFWVNTSLLIMMGGVLFPIGLMSLIIAHRLFHPRSGTRETVADASSHGSRGGL